jgi:hypothetical protein
MVAIADLVRKVYKVNKVYIMDVVANVHLSRGDAAKLRAAYRPGKTRRGGPQSKRRTPYKTKVPRAI